MKRESPEGKYTRELNDHSDQRRKPYIAALSESIPFAEIIGEFKEIYLTLKKRDAEKASLLLENHVRHFIDLIKNQLL